MISDKKIKTGIKIQEFLIILLSILIVYTVAKRIFNFNIFRVIPVIEETISFGMLFVTGFLTSFHCISMCGSINIALSAEDESKYKKTLNYNLGRLISYTILGGVVGLIGSVFEFNKYIQGSIILIVSIVMLLFSISMLGIFKFNLIPLNFNKIKTENSFIIGLLNGFMPCGPLQAMQLYALSTSSFYIGSLSMFLFCLGTIPAMLFMGILINYINSKIKRIMFRITSVIILILSVVMVNRGLLTLGIDITSLFSNDMPHATKSVMKDGYQVIEFDLDYGHYEDIIVQKNVPVKLIINVEKKYFVGCSNEILINEYDLHYKLNIGENIIEFTPSEEGLFFYTCWMNMIKNTIKVVDNLHKD